MTSDDELERRKFEAWFSNEFPYINPQIGHGNEMALVAKSMAWNAWLARSKQEANGE